MKTQRLSRVFHASFTHLPRAFHSTAGRMRMGLRGKTAETCPRAVGRPRTCRGTSAPSLTVLRTGVCLWFLAPPGATGG